MNRYETNRLRPLDGADADEAGESSGLKQVTDVLTRPEKTWAIATWMQHRRALVSNWVFVSISE